MVFVMFKSTKNKFWYKNVDRSGVLFLPPGGNGWII